MAQHDASVSRDFRHLQEPIDQTKFGTEVIAGIGGNPLIFTLPNQPMTMGALTTINDDYNTLITASSTGDTNKINARKSYHDKTWLPAFNAYAIYVEGLAQGNANTIVLSGFHATKTENTTHDAPVQMVLTAKGGVTTTVEFESDTKVDAHSFLLIGWKVGEATVTQVGNQVSIVCKADTILTVLPMTTKSGVAKGLVKGTDMNWVIIATNAIGSSMASNIANVMVP